MAITATAPVPAGPAGAIPRCHPHPRGTLLTKAPSLLLCDNKSVIALAKDDAFHSRTKHIDIRYHFIREAIDNGLINLDYCPTEDMAADMFTKILPRVKVDYFSELVGLHAL